MFAKFLFLMIVGCSSILMVKSDIHVQCKFGRQDIWNAKDVYACEATLTQFGDGNQITRVSGSHPNNEFDDDDVQAISIMDQDMKVFPTGFADEFKYITVIRIQRTGLQTISHDDLSVFEHLWQISFTGNDIATIHHDLFNGNSMLKVVSFADNSVRHVSQRAFRKLGLSALDFKSNPCIDIFAEESSQMENILRELSAKCPPTTDMIEDEILTGEKFQRRVLEEVEELMGGGTSPDLSVLISRLDDVDDRIDSVDESVNEQVGRINSIDESVNEQVGRLDGVDAALGADLGSLQSRVENDKVALNLLSNQVGDIEPRVTANEGTLTNHESRISALEP